MQQNVKKLTICSIFYKIKEYGWIEGEKIDLKILASLIKFRVKTLSKSLDLNI